MTISRPLLTSICGQNLKPYILTLIYLYQNVAAVNILAIDGKTFEQGNQDPIYPGLKSLIKQNDKMKYFFAPAFKNLLRLTFNLYVSHFLVFHLRLLQLFI